MKTLKKNRFLLVSILTVFVAVSAILGLSSFGKKTALAEETASETFVMEDGVSAKLSNGGGIRFRVKMDEPTGLSVKNGESALQIVVAPYYYFDKGVDYAIANGQKIDVEKAKVYQEGGAYYANGCITDIKEANRKLNLQAVAVISSGETVTKQTAVNVNAKGNMYDVLTSAVLDASGSYEKTIFKIAAYSAWFGTESYPITVLNDTEYDALKTKLAGEDGFKDKYYRIIKTVSGYNADDFSGISSNVELFKAANAITFADGSMDITYPAAPSPQATAKGGTVTYKYAAAKVENGKHVTVGELGDWNSVYNGAGTYCCIASTAGDDIYEAATAEKYFTVNKADNVINEFTVANITHGETPAPANVSATFGTPVITYANADKTVSGEWSDVYTKPAMYWCIVTVAESGDYKATSSERPYTVHKLENQITLDVSLDCNYGSGPNETLATATSGTPVYTYWLANEDDWGGVTEPGEDAEFKPWSECDKVGVYRYRITVAESDCYYAVSKEGWVRVHKKEADENGVKYTYADGSYGVSGYEGSNTTVTVAETFNDGANGEAAVTYVGANVFNNDFGHAVKKVVLPESITELKGLVFFNCANLEYLSMPGVTAFTGDGNNITFCYNLKTLIVKEGITIPGQQLQSGDESIKGVTTVYVSGTKTITIENADLNKLIGNIYYWGDGVECGTWKFDDNGDIVKGAVAHNFVNAVCKNCGEKDAMGVTYAYSAIANSYYVASYVDTTDTVIVHGTWNDGVNGEKPVTFVKNGAFSGKAMKKVILPASVTTLDGGAFLNCNNLEYVSMVGVTNIDTVHLSSRTWYSDVYSANDATGNNFLNCNALKTLIIGKNITIANNHIWSQHGITGTVNIYTLAISETDGTININAANNAMLTGNIYYYSETESTGAWHFDSDGNVALW